MIDSQPPEEPRVSKSKVPKPKLPRLRKPSLKLPNLQDPKTRFLLVMYGGAAIIATLFITAIMIPTMSSPVFCEVACHENTYAARAWKLSSHSKVTCYGCHSEPGLINLLKEKIFVGLPSGIDKFLGHEWPVNAESELSVEMDSEACERCHDMKKRNLTPSRGIIMNHEKHEEKGVNCPVCHNRIAHKAENNQDPNGVKYEAGERTEHKYRNGLDMNEGCFRCHTRKETEFREKRVEWQSAPTQCSTCHNQDFPLPVGHGDTWRANHRFEVEKQGKEYCLKCHNEEEFCFQCHDKGSI